MYTHKDTYVKNIHVYIYTFVYSASWQAEKPPQVAQKLVTPDKLQQAAQKLVTNSSSTTVNESNNKGKRIEQSTAKEKRIK